MFLDSVLTLIFMTVGFGLREGVPVAGNLDVSIRRYGQSWGIKQALTKGNSDVGEARK